MHAGRGTYNAMGASKKKQTAGADTGVSITTGGLNALGKTRPATS